MAVGGVVLAAARPRFRHLNKEIEMKAPSPTAVLRAVALLGDASPRVVVRSCPGEMRQNRFGRAGTDNLCIITAYLLNCAP